ncbi:TPA: hypothetical protein I0H51_RS04870 [Enterococcus faecalis]|uniref:hypothetical protein n=2 Tax=Enterococcus faecalis TaxID=1351 RepID=UPI0019259AB4|nr:hypothetical protein [Enterococcus faecalis]ELU8995672.1 hypothetical protein [Enterococcus faecalis]HAP3860753.1 hypothetical protein [Enterococcus faecalis]HBC2896495.1 hypothetical protein [Enterococcus faecalis]HBI2006573.1 hypothetical protein [Enterococcus faecalis]
MIVFISFLFGTLNEKMVNRQLVFEEILNTIQNQCEKIRGLKEEEYSIDQVIENDILNMRLALYQWRNHSNKIVNKLYFDGAENEKKFRETVNEVMDVYYTFIRNPLVSNE